MCDLFILFFTKLFFIFQDFYQLALGVLFTCKGVLICAFLSPAGLSQSQGTDQGQTRVTSS